LRETPREVFRQSVFGGCTISLFFSKRLDLEGILSLLVAGSLLGRQVVLW